jgi:hypothetical protein
MKQPANKIIKITHKCSLLKPNEEAYNNLLNTMIMGLIITSTNKDLALHFANELTDKTLKYESGIAFSFIWNNKYDSGLPILYRIVNILNEDEIMPINENLLLLLAKKQYHTVLKIFNHNSINLKEKLKPTYYSLMKLLKTEYPDEHIKMGKELEEPVDDVLRRIKLYAIDYA